MLLSVLFGWIRPPRTPKVPTTFPSMKLGYTDPVSELTCARLTTDGNTVAGFRANNYLQDMSGEQGGGSPWAPDSTRICYSKGISSGSMKPQGIYVMNVDTGVEMHLVNVSAFTAYPVWSRDGSDEIYYFEQGSGVVRVRAVHAVTGAVRTVFQVASNGQRQKIGINADGTILSAHIQPSSGGSYRTILAYVNGSGILPGWNIDGPASADGSYWCGTDTIIASRGNGAESGRKWNIHTLAQLLSRGFRVSHADVHPSGSHIYQIDGGTYVDLSDGDPDFDKGGTGQIHPRFFPCDSGLGDNARLVGDEAPFMYNPYNRSALWVFTPNQARTAPPSGVTQSEPQRAGTEVALHWSKSGSNGAHPHPSPSPDGTKIVWVSDKGSQTPSQWPADPGCPVGDLDGSPDLFCVWLTVAPPPDEPETTSTVVTSDTEPVEAGDTVTFTATVTPSGVAVPTGDATFYVDGLPKAVQPVVAGVATWATHTLTPGHRSVYVVYSGDVGCLGSTSASIMQTVEPVPPAPAVFARRC